MRDITPTLTPEIERHIRREKLTHAPPFQVSTYRKLVAHVARLAYLNKDHLLFYRGQPKDYLNRGGGSTFYPSIYRGDHLRRDVVESRFDLLERAGLRLHKHFAKAEVEGHTDLGRRPVVRWSVLQHYEVCSTPLLDLTHSLRVACSFAQREAEDRRAYVFAFGLPHLTNRISVNSEHDLVIVRLLSICPPAALRPYFQEGYLAGTADITTEYEPKTELDFSRRLIAKFEIPADRGFWGEGLSRMPDDELYPPSDSVKELCALLDLSPQPSSGAAALGEFVAAWTSVEQLLMTLAQRQTERAPTIREAINFLASTKALGPDAPSDLQALRQLRNNVVHGKERPGDEHLFWATQRLREYFERLQRYERRSGRKSNRSDAQ